MGDIDVETWAAPLARAPAPPHKVMCLSGTATRRLLATGVVLAAHVALLGAFVLKPIGPGVGDELPAHEPLMAIFVNAESNESQVTAKVSEYVPATVAVDLLEPSLGNLAFEEDAEHAIDPNAQFVPPRLENEALDKLDEFAQQTSLQAGRRVRVILRVEVLPDGTAGVIAVDTTSGVPDADEAAVRYARSLKWAPATFGGEPRRMKVRLPVVFTGKG